MMGVKQQSSSSGRPTGYSRHGVGRRGASPYHPRLASLFFPLGLGTEEHPAI